MKQREFPMLSALPAPRDADDRTLRRCDTEQDAIAVSIALARVSQAEIARRMGIARGYLTMLKKGERVLTSEMAAAFCSAASIVGYGMPMRRDTCGMRAAGVPSRGEYGNTCR